MSLRSWLRRGAVPLIAAGALAATLAGVAAARADDSDAIDIDGAVVPTTAEGFAAKDCGMLPPSIGEHEDGWVFVLPASKWRFTSVTASFTDAKGAVHSADATPVKPPNGTASSKHYIVTPAGWTLTGADALVEPKVERPGPKPSGFALLHTCAGTPDEPDPDPSSATPTSPEPSPSATSGPSSSASPSGSASPDDSGLPVTGRSLTLPLLAGLGLAAAGLALLVAARRRTARAGADPAD